MGLTLCGRCTGAHRMLGVLASAPQEGIPHFGAANGATPWTRCRLLILHAALVAKMLISVSWLEEVKVVRNRPASDRHTLDANNRVDRILRRGLCPNVCPSWGITHPRARLAQPSHEDTQP